jgi:hypothetical protein
LAHGDAVGSTTLCGGVLVPLTTDDGVDADVPEFAFVMASIGDVKAYRYSAATSQCVDVSSHIAVDVNRFRAEDCGGRYLQTQTRFFFVFIHCNKFNYFNNML